MRGVKYNIVFKRKREQDIIHNELDMESLKNIINEIFDEEFGIDDFNCTRNHIYNLIRRPNNCNKILKNLCQITKVN